MFHSVDAVTAKLCTPLSCMVVETERQLPRVRSLRLIKEDRYGSWLKFIAM